MEVKDNWEFIEKTLNNGTMVIYMHIEIFPSQNKKFIGKYRILMKAWQKLFELKPFDYGIRL